jgi:argininosuccinate lyase
MSGPLWDRGEGERLDRAVARFTVGRDPELDLHLVPHDALASAAHATMLARIGVLEPGELEPILSELARIAAEARAGSFRIAQSDEDCHTAIENRLTERLGDAGRRIHTGRSRNDQVLAALRLYGREAVVALCGGLVEVVERLLALAERDRELSLPGYTHTRQAMPSTLGLLWHAHAEALLDALPWLGTSFAHLNRSPLGSASGYGVPLPLDRQLVARLLAFDTVQANTLAVQNDRGKTEFLVLGAVAGPVSDLGRLASDLIGFSSDELGFIRLGAGVTTGSSIMPQKRNPDVLELVRASAARLRSTQAEVGAIYGPLASGYHRDLQLTKPPFLLGMETSLDAFAAMLPVLDSLEVDRERCRQALRPATAATDALYARVAAGEPFRAAYRAVAQDPVAAARSAGDPAELWRKRTHLGAPGALDLRPSHNRLAEARTWIHEMQQRFTEAWRLLPGAAE